MLDPATAGLVATGVLIGLVSALTPFLPVEAYVISVGITHPLPAAVGAALAAAVGQTAGKVVIFTSVRSAGRSRWLRRLRRRGAEAADGATGAGAPGPPAASGVGPGLLTRPRGRRLARISAGGLRLLSGRAGPLVVGVSGALGLPPLLAVAFCAGASPMTHRSFASACLLGRSVRFVVLAVAPGQL